MSFAGGRVCEIMVAARDISDRFYQACYGLGLENAAARSSFQERIQQILRLLSRVGENFSFRHLLPNLTRRLNAVQARESIGSGYGGGVAASRLACMGLRLAVLEQGRLWRPGDFPTTGKARLKTLRPTGRAQLGDPTGLYYLSVGKGLTVFGASGLGGGSLINAGATPRPDFGRLRKAGWPEAVVSDGLLLEGLARAEALHFSIPYCRHSAPARNRARSLSVPKSVTPPPHRFCVL